MRPYLEFESISKEYPGVRALSDVSFAVHAGSVHALLGENGAGKSTLLKILAGATLPTSGHLRVEGARRVFASTREAHAAGVAVIHQELNLVPELSVEENVLLGHAPSRFGFIDTKKRRELAKVSLAALGQQIDPHTKVKDLAIGQRQCVEIAKALRRGARVIAFDEPTSSLSERESRSLFATIRALRAEGRVILYISHRMEEIFALCDAITVLRDGRHVVTHPTTEGVTPDALIRAMVGRSIADVYGYAPRPRGEPILEVDALSGPGLSAPASFSVSRGEILGIFGLVGAGRSELLKLVFQAERPRAGAVRVEGRPVAGGPAGSIAGGMVLCPEDRKQEGIIPTASVAENINLSVRRRRALFLDGARERENAQHFARALGIRAPSLEHPVAKLSGGNQQKVILARGLSEPLKVVLLDEPTRGIDVGARSEIYAILFDLARQGLGLVVVSSDLPEVMGLSDRILVMRAGRIVGAVTRAEATAEDILKWALPEPEPRSAERGAARA